MGKKVYRFIKNNTWVIFVFIIVFPMIINFLLLTWHFPGIKGGYKDWLSFIATYSGGIIGGVTAYFVAKIQIDNEKELRQEEFNKDKQSIFYVIYYFLIDEINYNINQIPRKKIQDYIDGKLNYTHGFNPEFETSMFDDVKLELFRHINDENVGSTFKFYKMLVELKRRKVKNINDMDKEFAQSVLDELKKWDTKI